MDVTDLARDDNLKKFSAVGAASSNRRTFPGNFLQKILHEPLLHFLFLGAVLFLFFYWRGGGSGVTSNHIVVSRAQIEQLAVGFARTWQKPPTEAELKGLINEYVKEEMARREAVALGLDRDDVIIRRRLRQKLEFVAEDTSAATPLTDSELNAWMANHPDAFRSDPQVAFRQVYVSPQRHGASLKPNAVRLLAHLKAAGPNASIDHLGDPTMLPANQPLAPLFDTARTFGDDFAKALTSAAPGQWFGPVESPYGLHLVLVSKIVPASQQALSEVRPQVEREVLLDRKKKELQALYDRLLEKYTVKIEPLSSVPSGGAAK
jgi:hypothetical protein